MVSAPARAEQSPSHRTLQTDLAPARALAIRVLEAGGPLALESASNIALTNESDRQEELAKERRLAYLHFHAVLHGLAESDD
jgi:hypothetical protein